MNNKKSTEELYIVNSKHSALLGRVWICHLGIKLTDAELGNEEGDNYAIFEVRPVDEILKNYPEIFKQ